jgi:serine/threonine protein kinase
MMFHDALLGLNFLHTHNWAHGDLKPGNVGIIDWKNPRVVLLDFGGAVQLPDGGLLPSTPGRGGTVNYLAPERELQCHNALIDVWSLGVIGFELLYGYHPWKLALNPWRRGAQFEELRPEFEEMYGDALGRMKHHPETQSKTWPSRQ